MKKLILLFFIIFAIPIVFAGQNYIFLDPANDSSINTTIWYPQTNFNYPIEDNANQTYEATDGLITKFNYTANGHDSSTNLTFSFKTTNFNEALSYDTVVVGYCNPKGNGTDCSTGSQSWGALTCSSGDCFVRTSGSTNTDCNPLEGNASQVKYIRITQVMADDHLYVFWGNDSDNINKLACDASNSDTGQIIPSIRNTGAVTDFVISEIAFYNESDTFEEEESTVIPDFISPTPADGSANNTQVYINLSCVGEVDTILDVDFNENSNGTFTEDDSGFNHDGTVTNADITGGYIGNAYKFTKGDSTVIDFPFNGNSNLSGRSFTVTAWVNYSDKSSGSDMHTLITQGWYNGGFILGVFQNTDLVRFQLKNNGNEYVTHSNLTMSPNILYHLSATYYAGTNITRICVDNVCSTLEGATLSINPTSQGTFEMGSRISNHYWNGTIDEVLVIPRAVSQEVLTDIYNNRTFDSGLRHYLWFDNQTEPTTLVIDNSTTSEYLTSVVANDQYYYKAACFNLTSNIISDNTSTQSWIYDVTFPAITLNPNNAFTITNYSNEDQYDNNMHLNFTFSDNNDLFAYEILIEKDSVVYFNDTNESISGTSWDYNNTINTITWPEGTYNIQLLVADSHTAQKIPDYRITKKKSSITFKPGNDNNIKIETDSLSTIDATKQEDRYLFDVSFDDGLYSDRLFHIKSDFCPLRYKSNSGYKAHFVTFCGGTGNWIDFEGTNANYEVNKIDDYHYTVQFFNLEPNVLFRSIGGLNVYSANFTWYRGSAVTTDQNGYSFNPIIFDLNITFDSNTMDDINATLIWNGTEQTIATKTNYTDYFFFSKTLLMPNVTTEDNISYYWNVTTYQKDDSRINFNVNDSHLLRDFNVFNCTGGNITMNLSIFNEDYPTKGETAVLDLELIYWVNNRSLNKNLTTKLTGKTNYSICLDPQDQSYYADIYAKYTVDGGFTHRYYLFNHTLNNITQDIRMYNFNTTTDISNLKITVRRKATYQYYTNVIAKLQRNYIDEGVWRTVQMDRSGDFGLISFDVVSKSQDYRIIFTDINNTVLKETNTVKFNCLNQVCDDLIVLIDEISSSNGGVGLNVNTTFDNVTKNLTIYWSEKSGLSTTVKALVTKLYSDGEVELCNQQQTGISGTIICDLTGYDGLVYVQLQTSNSPFYSKFAEWLDLGSLKLYQIVGKNESSVFALFIMLTLIFAGALVGAVTSIILSILALIVLYFMGILSFISITFIILAMVIGVAIALKVKR